jgi:hypothetical protein
MPLPTNLAGFKKVGKFYTSAAPTDAVKVMTLCRAIRDAFIDKSAPKQITWILTGTHGTAAGELVKERKFFWNEDKTLETQMIKAVDVFNFSKLEGGKVVIGKNSWERYTGANAIVVLAWCFSEQSRKGWMKKAGLKGI